MCLSSKDNSKMVETFPQAIDTKKGFESFITKDMDMTHCEEDLNMIPCSYNTCHTLGDLDDISIVESCDCKYVWYCSEDCKRSDISHVCDKDINGIYEVETEKVNARLDVFSVGEMGNLGVVFTGTKRGNKYIRGKFSRQFPPTKKIKDGFEFVYVGGVTTVKINRVITIIPNGKGKLVTSWSRHYGMFDMGRGKGRSYATTISGVKMVGDWEGGLPVGIHNIEREGYKAFGYMKETKMKTVCTSRDIHDSWKKTEYSVCMEKKGPFGKFLPVLVKKDILESRFKHTRVVGMETVGKVKFRKTVHWTGDDGPHGYFCTDGPLISFSSNNTCSKHGQWNYGSICPDISSVPREEISLECTCNKEFEISRKNSNSYVTSKPAPLTLPKVKRCKGGRSNKSLKKTHVEKDTNIRGVSKRDMSVDLAGMSKDMGTILEEGGWDLSSTNNHLKYTRFVDGKKQNFVCAKTSSDVNSWKSEIRVMKNLSRIL